MPDLRGGELASYYILEVLVKTSLIFAHAWIVAQAMITQDTVPLGILNLASWFLLTYMVTYPQSKLSIGICRCFHYLNRAFVFLLAAINLIFGCWLVMFMGEPAGTICIVVGTIIEIHRPRLARFEPDLAQAMNDVIAALHGGAPHGNPNEASDSDWSSESDDSGESTKPVHLLSPDRFLTLSDS